MMRLASITDDGHIKCPECGCVVITPMGMNPNNGKLEKMILIKGHPGQCGLCKTAYTVDEEQALKHNHYWYPDDPEFKLPEKD